MKIVIEAIKENEDGSANCIIDMDEEAVKFLIQKALLDVLNEACGEGSKYSVKEEDNEH